MPLTLYHCHGSAPSRAVLMTCRAIGLDVDVRVVDVLGGETRQDWFLKMNPLHTVPTLDDNGFSIWESRSVMRYVMNKYAISSDIYPQDPKQRALVDQMLDFDLSNLADPIRMATVPVAAFGAPAPDHKRILSSLEYLDKHTPIAAGKFIAGDKLTLGDICVSATLSWLELIDFNMAPFPHLAAWLQKVKQQSCYADVNGDFLKFKDMVKSGELGRRMAAMMKK